MLATQSTTLLPRPVQEGQPLGAAPGKVLGWWWAQWA